MPRPAVLLTARWPSSVEAALKARYDVTFNPDDHAFSAQELKFALQRYDAVCPTVVDRIDSDVLSAHTIRCKILANFGVGVNHIDLEAAKARAITVTNTPDVLTDCTADLAMALLLMISRRIGEGEREVRTGHWRGWRPTHLLGTQVTNKTLGIIGMGRIGQAMARRAHLGFGMRILYYHPRPVPPAVTDHLDAESCSSIDDLLPRCDFLSLHCPGGERNRHLIDERRLSLMPSHACLINTARGDLVDTHALIGALEKGMIQGAGLDVFENEPHIEPALLRMGNVVLLPHLGSATSETREAMGFKVLANLDAFFAGQAPPDRVI